MKNTDINKKYLNKLLDNVSPESDTINHSTNIVTM